MQTKADLKISFFVCSQGSKEALAGIKASKNYFELWLEPQFFLDNLFEPLKLSWSISCPEENFPYRNRILPQHDLPAPKHVQLHFIGILTTAE